MNQLSIVSGGKGRNGILNAAPAATGINIKNSLVPFVTDDAETMPAAQSYFLKASKVTESITVTAPADFEISTDGVTFEDSLVLPNTYSGRIHVRLSVALAGGYSGTISHVSAGQETMNVHVSGYVAQVNADIDATNYMAIDSADAMAWQ